MAHKKGGGATNKNRDSTGKRLGVKIFGGQMAKAGSIIIRQRGTNFFPGDGTMLGKDHTIFAIKDGKVEFRKNQGKRIVFITSN